MSGTSRPPLPSVPPNPPIKIILKARRETNELFDYLQLKPVQHEDSSRNLPSSQQCGQTEESRQWEVVTCTGFTPTVPKKRGRPVKRKNLVIDDVIPKKKRKPGRPPKPKTAAEQRPVTLKKASKKSGRRPRPKKRGRGRPPKPKSEQNIMPKTKRCGKPPNKPFAVEDLPKTEKLKREENLLKVVKIKNKWINDFEEDCKFVAHQVPSEFNQLDYSKKASIAFEKSRIENPVPAFRPRHVMSCRFCQQWSWDLSHCSSCLRAPLPHEKFLLVEEHEILSDAVDKSRPVFRSPPIPMFRPGEVYMCPFCFYCTPVGEKNCAECDEIIPPNSLKLKVEFPILNYKKNLLYKYDPNIFTKELKLRELEGSDLAECPGCGLTFSLAIQCRRCPHCRLTIPKKITLTVRDRAITETEKKMLDGIVELPHEYRPQFYEGWITQCRWCRNFGWDLNRCHNCYRKLPRSSELFKASVITERVGEVSQCDPKLKVFPPPALLGQCRKCHRYSSQLFQCEYCDDSNVPYCTQQSSVGTNTLSEMPSVKVVPRAPPKLRSIFMAPTLGHLMAVPTKAKLKESRIPDNYVPRYRELGAAQCPECLAWTFDMAFCGSCQAPLMLDPHCPPPFVFSQAPFDDPDVERQRPIFAARPVPYLQPGRVTLCLFCCGYTTGGAFCTLCGKVVDSQPQYVNIDFKSEPESFSSPNTFQLPYTPRTTLDGKLALCPHCGFTTENFHHCSYCQTDIPTSVVIVPENHKKDFFFPLWERMSDIHLEGLNISTSG